MAISDWWKKKKEAESRRFTIEELRELSKINKIISPSYNPADEFRQQISAMRDLQEVMRDANRDEQERIIEAAENMSGGEDDGMMKMFLELIKAKGIGAPSGTVAPNAAPIPKEIMGSDGSVIPVNPTQEAEIIEPLTSQEELAIDTGVIPQIPKKAKEIFKSMPENKKKAIINRIVEKLQ